MKRLLFLVLILLLVSVGTVQGATYLSAYDGYKVLNMHMNGTSGGTTFTDETGKTVTRYGDTNTNTGVKKLGSASGYFDGNGDYLALADSTDWTFGNNNFTIIISYNGTSSGNYQQLIGQYGVSSSGIWSARASQTNDKKFAFTYRVGTTYYDINTNTVIGGDNLWRQLAIVRNNATNKLYFYVNGTEVANVAPQSGAFADVADALTIGKNGFDNAYITGYVDEVGIWNGVAIPIAELYPQTYEIGQEMESALVSSFTPNQTVGYFTPMPVTFTDNSTGSPTTWNYTFGDTYTSTLQNPSHIYTVANNYTVSQNVTNVTGGYSVSTKNVELKTDDSIWLKSWMPFNNATVIDLKGNAWTSTGATISNDAPKFGTGSLAIQANDARITSASSTIWDRSLLSGELEFWINVTALGDAGKPLIKRSTGGTGTADGWGFFNTNGTVNGYSFWYGNSAANFTTPINIPMNTQTHIALVRNTSQYWNVYKNGILQTGKYVDSVNVDTANPMQIGANGGGIEFQFKVDEFRYTQGNPIFVSNFDVPYAQYNGNLYVNYTNINPNATLRYKTNPTDPLQYNYNQTGARHRTIQIQNITNASTIAFGINFNPTTSLIAGAPVLNATVYNDMILDSYSIDSLNGVIKIQVSRPLGIKALFDNRTELVDIPILYYKYTSDATFDTFFTEGNLTDSEHSVTYPITNFISTPIGYGEWGEPIVNFSADNTNPGQYTTVQFTDATGNYPSAWGWDFGDGSTSSLQNPTHVYTSLGLKDVTVHAYMYQNASVTNTSTKTGYINVTTAPPPPPVANFAGVPTKVAVGSPVMFTDLSTNTPTSWLWNFGDSTTSSLQNPVHAYSTIGFYTVNLTATNAIGSNTTSKVNYINVNATGEYGFNQQDLIMIPQFTLHVAIVDSATNLPIPVVSVLDSVGNTQVTSAGIFTQSYNYSAVVLYLTATDYTGRSVSYVMDSDRTEIIQLTKSSSTNQNANIVWQPRSVAIQVLDSNYNPIIGIPVHITAHNSSLPGGLSGAVEYFKNTYGVTDSTAQSMFNSSVEYSGNTDDNGFIATQVIDIIQYQVVTQDTSGATVTRLFWPSGAYYQIVTGTALVSGIAAQGRTQASINMNSTFNTTFWEPNTTYSCMGVNVYDSTGATNFVYAWWKLVDNGTIWDQNTTVIGGYGPINSSKCVLHVPYQQWKWGGITG